jgi:dihydroorotate dehydrogenase
MKFSNDRSIPPIVISTIGGHGGSGLPFYCFDPHYNHLMATAKETRTPLLTKSATFDRHIGNVVYRKPRTIWQYIRRIENEGMVNAYGLTNPGSQACAKKIAKSIKSGSLVIPNYYPQFILAGSDRASRALLEVVWAVDTYRRFLGNDFWAIELNFSCPNSEDQIAKNMDHVLACLQLVRNHYPWLIVIAKMSYVQPDELFVEIDRRKLADALHCFNTIDFRQLYGYSSPLKNGAGGVSGGPIRQKCFERNRHIAKLVSLPIIMGGGVPADQQELQKYFDIGASSLSLCTSAIYHPLEAGGLLHAYNA